MEKLVLTFDDGPSENFPKLLDILIENNNDAIFFCSGRNLEKNVFEKDLIKSIKNGFIIGNHAYSHPSFNEIPYSKGKEEIHKTDEIIDNLYKKADTERPLKLFRFPYFHRGRINFPRYQRLLKNLGYSNPYPKNNFFSRPLSVSKMYSFFSGNQDVYYDFSSRDWDQKIKLDDVKITLKKAQPNNILVLHDLPYNFELVKEILNYYNTEIKRQLETFPPCRAVPETT